MVGSCPDGADPTAGSGRVPLASAAPALALAVVWVVWPGVAHGSVVLVLPAPAGISVVDTAELLVVGAGTDELVVVDVDVGEEVELDEVVLEVVVVGGTVDVVGAALVAVPTAVVVVRQPVVVVGAAVVEVAATVEGVVAANAGAVQPMTTSPADSAISRPILSTLIRVFPFSPVQCGVCFPAPRNARLRRGEHLQKFPGPQRGRSRQFSQGRPERSPLQFTRRIWS